MKKLTFALVVLFLGAPAVFADTLQKNRIPAGVRWLVHLDVEAMKSSKLYEVLHAESAKDGVNEIDEGLAQFKMFAGLDPTLDFKSVTLYCADGSGKSCVALLSGNERIDEALLKMKSLPNYHTTPVGSYALHTWGGDHDTWYAQVHRAESSSERIVVASQDTAALVRGLALLEHGGESLADSGGSLSATPASGSILFAAAWESLKELADVEPVSVVARLAKTIVLDVGESRGTLSAHVSLDARTPEDAQRMQQVLQGAVALLGLVGGDEQDAARASIQHLVEALHLSVSNTRLDADFRYDVKSLIEEVKSLDEAHEKAGGDRDRHHGKKRHPKPQEEDH